MRIIKRRTLVEFWAQHNDATQPLKAWYAEAKKAKWRTPEDIKKRYRRASIIADNRVIFDIAGNKYRLIVKIHYNTSMVYIRFIGTHAEYDKIDAGTI